MAQLDDLLAHVHQANHNNDFHAAINRITQLIAQKTPHIVGEAMVDTDTKNVPVNTGIVVPSVEKGTLYAVDFGEIRNNRGRTDMFLFSGHTFGKLVVVDALIDETNGEHTFSFLGDYWSQKNTAEVIMHLVRINAQNMLGLAAKIAAIDPMPLTLWRLA